MKTVAASDGAEAPVVGGTTIVAPSVIEHSVPNLPESAASSNGMVSDELMRRLVIQHIVVYKNVGLLDNTALFKRYDVRNFIASHAEWFYLSMAAEAYIEYLRDKMCHAKRMPLLENLMEDYVSALVELSPDLIIDDIVYESLDLENYDAQKCVDGPGCMCECGHGPSCICPSISTYSGGSEGPQLGHAMLTDSTGASKMLAIFAASDGYILEESRSFRLATHQNYTLRWVYHLLAHKHFQRPVLRHIFDQLLYFDSNDNIYSFKILELIINKYSRMDKLIKNYEIRKNIKEAHDALTAMRTKNDSSSASPLCAIESFVRGMMHGGTANKISIEALLNEDTKIEACTAIAKYIDEIKGKLVPESPRDPPERLYCPEDVDLHNDNAYVLSNLVWEELVLLLRSDAKAPCAAVQLLASIIKQTGDFLQRRIVENRTLLRNIGRGSSELAMAVVDSFSSIDGLFEELVDCVKRNKPRDELAILKKLASKNHALLDRHWQADE